MKCAFNENSILCAYPIPIKRISKLVAMICVDIRYFLVKGSAAVYYGSKPVAFLSEGMFQNF